MIPFKHHKDLFYVNQYICVLIIFSLLFSIYFFRVQEGNLIRYFYPVIFIDQQSSYYLYLFGTIIYIALLIVFSSSYFGLPFISLSLTFKILQLVYAMIQLQSIEINLYNLFVVILPQFILEFLLIYMSSFFATYLSLQSFLLSFVFKDNFHLKKIVNYYLDYILIVVVIIFLSVVIKIYCV